MPSTTYSFLDVAALDGVRERFAAGDALAILSGDLEEVIWANGPGALLFDHRDVEAIIGAKARLGHATRRQIAATRGFPAIGRDRPVAVRLTKGVSSRIVAFLASAVILPDGEEAILLAVPAAAEGSLDAAAIARRAISGFAEPGHFVALVDAGGAVEAAAPGFAALGLTTETLAGMTARLAGGQNRIAKRMLPSDGGSLPAGMVRLTDDPARHLLVVIDENWATRDQAAAEAADKEAAHVEPNESAILAPDVASSVPASAPWVDEPMPPVEDIAAAEPVEAGHDDWYFNADAESVAQETLLPETSAAGDGDGSSQDLEAERPTPEVTEPAETAVDDAPAVESEPVAKTDANVADPAAEAALPAPAPTPTPTVERATTAVRFVWRTDADGRFNQISPEFAAAVGEPAADVIGRRFEEVANAFGFDPAGEISGLLARRDTWSGRSVLWPVAGTDLRIPVDLAALPVYNRARTFEGFRGFGVARGGDAVPDPEGLGLVLVPGPFDAPRRPETQPSRASVDEQPKPDDADKGGDPFRGEVPALTIAPAADRRFTDKIIRLAEHRPATPPDKGLSAVERIAFQQIGERLKQENASVVFGKRPAEPASAVAPEAPVDQKVEDRPSEPAPSATGDSISITESAAIDNGGMPDAASAPGEAVIASDDAAPAEAEPAGAVLVEATADRAAPGSLLDGSAKTAGASDEVAVEAVAAEQEAPAAEATVQVAPEPVLLETETKAVAEAMEPAAETVEPKAAEPAASAPVAAPPVPARKGPRPGMSLLDFARWDEAEEAGDAENAAPPEDQIAEAVEDTPARIDAATEAAAELAAVARNGAEQTADEAAVTTAEASAEDFAAAEADVADAEAATQAEPVTETVADAPQPSGPPAEAESPAPPVAKIIALADAAQSDLPRAPGEERRRATDTAILEKLPVPVLVHSGDTLHYANDEFFKLTGYDSIADLALAGGIGILFADPYEDEAGGTDRRDRQLRLKAKDGAELPVEAFLQSAPWNGGKALLLVLSRVKDGASETLPSGKSPLVSELETLVSEMRTIIDTATDGVVLIAPDGTIRSISRPAEALFGFDSDEVAGKPFGSLFAIESQKAARDYLAGLSDNGVASVLNDGREVIGRESEGRFIPLFMTIGKLPNDSGYCAVVRDITQWKRAEEELTQARSVAERASSHKTDFLARVSHEIRTPLNAIIGFSELMLDEKFGPVANDRYRDYLRDINRSGNHVLDLVNDLLDISKIEAGEQDMAYEAVSLNETLAETVAMMQPQANRERVIIRSSFASKLPDVVADLRSVRQIALNILSNAVRYTQAGGQVIVSTAYETGGDIVMRVRDTGIGMTQAEIEQALKPFKQINSLRRARGDGTGLGLPLTKAMVEANRAKFVINSSPGEGTLVEVVFPSTRVLAD